MGSNKISKVSRNVFKDYLPIRCSVRWCGLWASGLPNHISQPFNFPIVDWPRVGVRTAELSRDGGCQGRGHFGGWSGQCSQCSRLQLASLRSCRWRALHLPQCAKERAKARAEEPSEAPAAAAGRDHYAIIGTRNLATSGFKSRLRSMKVSSRINGEFRFMTGKNINSAIISDMGRNGL